MTDFFALGQSIARANMAQAQTKALNAEMLDALRNAAFTMRKLINDLGGCDHTVGICMCDEIRACEAAESVIWKAEGGEAKNRANP